jgi:acyl-CoA synthetase (AMP-forming)/AMP-acid ligase II
MFISVSGENRVGLAMLLDMATAGHGSRLAFGSDKAGGFTFSDLGRLAEGGGGLLASREASHAVLLARNGPVLPTLLFASAKAGVPLVPLNYRASLDQLLDSIYQFESPLVVADDDYLSLLPDTLRTLSTDAFFAECEVAEPVHKAEVSDDEPAVILYTSGTTSRPKAAILRHRNLISYILSTVEFGAAAEEEAALVSVPPYHVAAIGSVLSNVYAGRRVIYLPDFDPQQWLDLVEAERITSAMLVPTMMSRILQALDGQSAKSARSARAPSLRLISYGGARMPPGVLRQALAAFPAAGFCNAYGLTETSSTIALLTPEDHRQAIGSDDPAIRGRLRSVGRAVPGIEVEIRGPDGLRLPVGERGHLWVRGQQISGEYSAVGSLVDAGGWFDTRDEASIDLAGYIYLEGRTDDLIIRGAENIAPAEIEDVLAEHPAVAEVAVLGQPDDEWGEKIIAVVVPNPGSTSSADELREFVRARLRSSRTPDEIVWRDELPHNETGKLLRRQLAEELIQSKQ